MVRNKNNMSFKEHGNVQHFHQKVLRTPFKFAFNKRKLLEIQDKHLFLILHCVKSIQSEYRKLRTRKNSVFGHFSRILNHPCRSVTSIKLLCNFIEIALQYGCSPVNFCIFSAHHLLRTRLNDCFCSKTKI